MALIQSKSMQPAAASSDIRHPCTVYMRITAYGRSLHQRKGQERKRKERKGEERTDRKGQDRMGRGRGRGRKGKGRKAYFSGCQPRSICAQ